MLNFRSLLYLFVGFRLIMLIVHQPQFIENPANPAGPLEVGITLYGDFGYHFGIARNADAGLLPYRDFWYEYPPVIPVLSGVVYALSGPNFSAYANLLALVLTAFDVGNLLLVRRIGVRLYGASAGEPLAWLYALMVAPFILAFWNFEAVLAFTVLLAVLLLIGRHDLPAGLVIALGALTKLVPLVLLGAVWRYRPASAALRISVIAVGIALAGFAGVLLVGPRYGLPSLSAQFSKSSYQTIWALLDGNYTTGIFDTDRLDPAKATELRGNPAVVPWWLRGVAFGGIGAAIYATVRRFDDAGLLAFAAITVVIFYLWSQGWSPQWQAALVPLILLTLPGRIGVLLCIALAVFSFAEYPLIFVRGIGPDGSLRPEFVPLFSLTVLARTALLIFYAALLYVQLRGPARASSA